MQGQFYPVSDSLYLLGLSLCNFLDGGGDAHLVDAKVLFCSALLTFRQAEPSPHLMALLKRKQLPDLLRK